MSGCMRRRWSRRMSLSSARRIMPGRVAARPVERERVRSRLRRADRASGSGSSTPFRDPGEFGNDTWLNDSWSYTGNTGVWAQMTVDEELELVYIPVEMPTGDYYGGHRPGDTLFGESLVAVDLNTGVRKWHYQLVHHGIWDYDIPCAPILMDLTVDGRTSRRSVSQPSRAGSTCSIASRASRCGRSKSDRSRRATCPASGTRRRSHS